MIVTLFNESPFVFLSLIFKVSSILCMAFCHPKGSVLSEIRLNSPFFEGRNNCLCGRPVQKNGLIEREKRKQKILFRKTSLC